MRTLPNPDTLAKYRSLVNYKDIEVNTDSSTIFLKYKGMQIGFGGIGQGYAANRCKKVMLDYGIKCGYVDVSGDITFWGKPADGSLWKVAIGSPVKRNEAVAWIELTDMAIVTSGDYEQYTIIDGKQYTHIIDPRTGYRLTMFTALPLFVPMPN
jgi:thiamine biosynthesis lipoprotein